MRNVWVVSALLLTANSALAQKNILVGKILDEHNKPVKKAEVLIVKVNNMLDYRAKVTDDGLYYTDSVYSGDYNVFIVVNSVSYQTKVRVEQQNMKPLCYAFKISNGKVEATGLQNDPFMQRELDKVKKETATIIY